jgi:hypothetical protein
MRKYMMSQTIATRILLYVGFLIFTLNLSSCDDNDEEVNNASIRVVFKGITDTIPAFNPITYQLVEATFNGVTVVDRSTSTFTGILTFYESLKASAKYEYYLVPSGPTFENYVDEGNMVIPVPKTGLDTTVYLERSGKVKIHIKNIRPVNSSDRLEIKKKTNGKLQIPKYDIYTYNNANDAYYFTGTGIDEYLDCKISPRNPFTFEYYITKDTLGLPLRRKYTMQFPMHSGQNPTLEIRY